MADKVNLTINGRAAEAAPGALVIDVAKKMGIEIPAFCYYEGLSLQAACRMCLVQVNGSPKLQAGCTLQVAEGMNVETESAPVVAARKSTLEFLLSNHPLDCPVCDKGGECELQDMVFKYGAGESRFIEMKHHRPEQQWSPVVYFDPGRCILCFRCVRVCNEGMGVGALGIQYRGVAAEIIPNMGDHLKCDECGACVDICPVGALTSGTYRYKTRPWEMNHVGTVCTFCSNGCKTTLGVKNDKIIRGNNRDRSGINDEFLCVKGRYAFDALEHADRLQSPMVRENGELKPVSWSKALALAAAKLRDARERNGRIAIIAGTKTTNEENFFLQKLARQGLGTNHIDHRRSGDVVTLIDSLSGKTGKLATARDLYEAKAAVVIGSDLSQQHPFLAYQLRANVRHHGAQIFAITSGPVREDKIAARSIRAEAGTEIAHLESLRDALKAAGDVVFLYGDSVKGALVRKLVDFGESLGIPAKYVALVDHANSRGAMDMGLAPELLPGYHAVSEAGLAPGMTLPEILADAALDVLWVAGANPLANGAALASPNAFVIVNELYATTETAARADLLLPAASLYEKNGTLTNVTGEVQKLKPAVKTMGAKPDLEIFGLIAKELGLQLGIWTADHVFEEIRKTVPGYNVPVPVLATGGAAPTAPVNGRVAVDVRPELIRSAGDTLFTSGTMGRYSKLLKTVPESPDTELYQG
jgi:NADH-quinone oxidoreductase subunit G